jgi:hypothetical protein
LKKVVYLTFNDAPSGIYAGQVIDVCRYWKEELKLDVHLIAFISLRGFGTNKRRLKKEFPGAIVLPMVPKARNWKLNKFLLGQFIRKIDPAVIVGRGAFATALAFNFRKNRKVCFDGRGAYYAELNEYNVVPDEKVKREIQSLERKVVLESDFRVAVSQQLVEYWKEKFNYSSDKHVVIPCTLNSGGMKTGTLAEQAMVREKFGFDPSAIIIVYSGSGAGWQSLKMLDDALLPAFKSEEKLRLLLLVHDVPGDFQLIKNYPGRVKKAWLKPEEVMSTTSCCDYGWLVREKSDTNRVASPVKFAEYLAAGLHVIISPELGDYPGFVKQHNAGLVWEGNTPILFDPVAPDEKKRMISLAHQFFTKEVYRDHYLRLLA